MIFIAAMSILPFLSHPTMEEFRQELNMQIVKQVPAAEETCTIFLVYSGSTDWLETGRIQGWEPVHLNESGIQQMHLAAEQFEIADIAAVYASSIPSAREGAEIFREKLNLERSVVAFDELRGECHGEYDGYTRQEYAEKPHFQQYKGLLLEDQIFFPCGEGEKNGNRAESKADVARRAIPKIKEIASKHIGETVIIVTHRALFSLFNLHLRPEAENRPRPVGHGTSTRLEVNSETLYLISED